MIAILIALFICGLTAGAWFYLQEKEEPPKPVQPVVVKKKKSHQKKVDKTANLPKKAKKAVKKVSVANDPWLVQALRGPNEDVTDVSFSDCGRFVCCASEDRTIRIFTPESGKEFIKGVKTNYARINLSRQTATACAFSSDSKYMAVALSPSQRVDFYGISLKDNRVTAELKSSFETGHKETITTLLFGAGSGYVVTLCRGQDTSVKVWRPRGDLIKELNTKQMENYMGDVSRDGRFLCVATRMAEAKIWGFISATKGGGCVGVEQCMALKGHKKGLNAVGFGECDEFNGPKVIATGSFDGTWRIYDIAVAFRSSEDPKVILDQASGFPSVEHIAMAPRKNGLVALSHGGTVQFRDREGTLLKSIEAHKDGVRGMQWGVDGLTLITFGGDKCVRVWRAAE